MIKLNEFLLKYALKNIQQLKTREPHKAGDIQLPLKVLIHYVSDTDSDYGIRKSHPLMVGQSSPVRVSHVVRLTSSSGNPKLVNFNLNSTLTTYFKSRPNNFSRVRKLERTMREQRSIMVMDYSLLSHMYKYPKTRTSFFESIENTQSTIWHHIKEIGDIREQFIIYRLPEVLPNYQKLKYLADPIPTSLLTIWKDEELLGLVELWRLLEKRDVVSMEAAEHIHLVVLDANRFTIINLAKLWEWAEDNLETTQKALYAAWELLMGTRTVINSHATEGVDEAAVPPEEEHVIGADHIVNTVSDMVMAGQLSGAEQKRIWKLVEGYKVIPSPTGKGTLEDLIKIDPEELVLDSTKHNIPDKPTIVDKSMLGTTINDFNHKYVADVLEADVAAATLSVQGGGVLVKDYKAERSVDALNDFKTYKVSLIPIKGKPSTISFKLPVVSESGVFKANGVKYRLDAQRGDIPIRKVSSSRVALTSYYGKLFIVRSPNASNNVSRWIIGHITKIMLNPEDKTLSNLVFTSAVIPKAKLPRMYTALSGDVRSFDVKALSFYFNYKSRKEVYGDVLVTKVERSTGMVVCGSRLGSKGSLLVMGEDGVVHAVEANGKLTELDTIPAIINPEWGDGPIEYAIVKIYGKPAPLGVILGYHMGLDALLDMLDAKHRWVHAGTAVSLQRHEFRIQFKDETLVLDRRDVKSTLVLGGFLAIKNITPQHSAGEFNRKGIYGHAIEGANLGRRLLKEYDLMNDMFVDPITKELLVAMDEPVEMDELLLRSAELLVDDDWTDEMDLTQMRIRGYERFSGFVYNQMVNSIREQRGSGNPSATPVTMSPNAVWNDIMSDTALTLIEESNPIHNLKEMESITFTGQGGRSAQTMVARSRVFHKNDVGIVSESTPDSAKVGIRAYMTPNANLNSLRGTTDRIRDSDGFSTAVSTTALTAPGTTHMDAKRVNLGSIQQSSMVPSAGSVLLPVRTGYEQIIAQRCGDDFAYDAKGPGTIKEITDEHMLISYTDVNGIVVEKSIDLGITHGVASGTVMAHTMVTDHKVGDKFKIGDVLVWNTGYFKRDILNPGGVSTMGGVLARTVLMESTDTIEDSSAISRDLSEKLTTPISKAKTILISSTDAVTNMVKVGDVLTLDTPLCLIEDSNTAALAVGDSSLAGLSKLDTSTPKAKFEGTVTAIDVIYMGNPAEMDKTVQSIISADTRKRKAKAKRNGGETSITGEITSSTYVGGQKVIDNTVAITVYIDATSKCGIGDKSVYDNALKTITGRIMEGENISEDGRAIDAIFGYNSISNRIILSPTIYGTTNSALIAVGKRVTDVYFG